MVIISAMMGVGSLSGKGGRQLGDLGDIEAKRRPRLIEFFKTEPSCLERIVARDGLSRNPCAKDRDQHKMLIKPALGGVVEDIDGRKDSNRLRPDPGFLQKLTDGCAFDALSEIDLAAGEPPTTGVRRIGPLH